MITYELTRSIQDEVQVPRWGAGALLRKFTCSFLIFLSHLLVGLMVAILIVFVINTKKYFFYVNSSVNSIVLTIVKYDCRQCPSELQEAIASIIFAAPRCSDLPDLLQVKNLFTSKYGKEFISAVCELRPDTSVNRTVEKN